MKQIPNLFTLLNLFFGCIAIVYLLQTNNYSYYQNNEGGFIFAGLESIPEEWWYGSLFIALAAVVDFLDGFVARWLNATSDLGKQLDSLADVVSFGVAPGMILYQLLRMSYMQEADGMDTAMWWLFPAFAVPCAAAYRLGRFNISTDQDKYFTGVPVPAIGLVVASFPLVLYTNTFTTGNLLLNKWIIYLLIAVLSWLMVCRYKMLSLKFSKAELRNQLPLLALGVIGIVAGLFLKWLAVPLVFVGYVVLSLLQQQKMKQ